MEATRGRRAERDRAEARSTNNSAPSSGTLPCHRYFTECSSACAPGAVCMARPVFTATGRAAKERSGREGDREVG
eukprot:3711574-Pyramimonas_sp.AAC.1